MSERQVLYQAQQMLNYSPFATPICSIINNVAEADLFTGSLPSSEPDAGISPTNKIKHSNFVLLHKQKNN
jgi:hypothetical protein